MKGLKVVMEKSKVTKGTIMFATSDPSQPVGNVYVKKGTLIDGKNVDDLASVAVTVSLS